MQKSKKAKRKQRDSSDDDEDEKEQQSGTDSDAVDSDDETISEKVIASGIVLNRSEPTGTYFFRIYRKFVEFSFQ